MLPAAVGERPRWENNGPFHESQVVPCDSTRRGRPAVSTDLELGHRCCQRGRAHERCSVPSPHCCRVGTQLGTRASARCGPKTKTNEQQQRQQKPFPFETRALVQWERRREVLREAVKGRESPAPASSGGAKSSCSLAPQGQALLLLLPLGGQKLRPQVPTASRHLGCGRWSRIPVSSGRPLGGVSTYGWIEG